MNLTKLFEMQKILDERIELEHPRQDGEDRLAKKILALQVELGELANEWRGFKFWSKNQQPRKPYQDSKWIDGRCYNFVKNPLLEEYVDCLHFILSIGLEIDYEESESVYLHEGNIGIHTDMNLVEQFAKTYSAITQLLIHDNDFEWYEELFLNFIGISRHLRFTWEEIENAYISKNEVNHNRQDTGY